MMLLYSNVIPVRNMEAWIANAIRSIDPNNLRRTGSVSLVEIIYNEGRV
jgi:hypothetical protein